MNLPGICGAIIFGAVIQGSTPAPLPIGSLAPEFQLPTLEGNPVSLQDLRTGASDESSNVIAVVFWSHRCPWVVKGWDPVLQSLRDRFRSHPRVRFAVIDSNWSEIDKPREIRRYLRENQRDHRVLLDTENKVADAFGSQVTPHAFVIDREGRIVYRGRIDDSIEFPGDHRKPEQDTRHFLRDAIEAALLDRAPQVAVDQAQGCTIRRVPEEKP